MKVAYIIGLGHSGSTLLDLLLNAHSMVASVGELKDLHARAHRPPSGKKFCACGAPTLEQCQFWSKVAWRLQADHGLDIRSVVTDCGDGRLRVGNAELLRAVADVAGTDVVVDSSKDIGRLRALLREPVLTIFPIFLVRDPKGQVSSGLKKKKRGLLPLIASYNWRSLVIARLLRNRPSYFLRYEDLVADPAAALGGLLAAVGLSFEAAQLNWADAEHHNCGGNRDVRLASSSEIRHDESWRRTLSPMQKLIIDAGTLPARMVLAARERAAASGPVQ